MPPQTITSLLECSGNSRVFLKPSQVSIRWELGGVSNAEWTGVRLSDVLKRARVGDGAVEVILEGADKGEFKEPEPKTPGVIQYARSLSLQKARQPEVLVAYQMNDKQLPVAHGFRCGRPSPAGVAWPRSSGSNALSSPTSRSTASSRRLFIRSGSGSTSCRP